MKYLFATVALLLAATAANAAPKLPTIFHGRWCGENHWLQRCAASDDGIRITADGFEYEAGEYGCRLAGLTLQRPSRRDSEYRATFVCGGEKTKAHREFYWLGFYDDGHDVLFLNEANSTFTAGAKPK